MRDIQRGADIVVGTPGRIMDLQARGALDLSAVCYFLAFNAQLNIQHYFLSNSCIETWQKKFQPNI